MFRLLLLTLVLEGPHTFALVCKVPFNISVSNSFCIHLSPTGRDLNYCAAQHYCRDIGGEMLMSDSRVMDLHAAAKSGTVAGLRTLSYIGLTDSLTEKLKVNVGWQYNDGSLQFNSEIWKPSDPNNGGGAQDCVIFDADSNQTWDYKCSNTIGVICQSRTLPALVDQVSFVKVTVPQYNTTVDDVNNCFDEIYDVENINVCIARAARGLLSGESQNPKTINYPALYYNENLQKCVLLKFFNSTLSLAGNKGWVKYILDSTKNNE